jgi:hypothetical protein
VFPHVDTRDPGAVLNACRAAWQTITRRDDRGLLARALGWVQTAFDGENPDYEPLDTRYHDLEHTLQGTLCLARLLTGWHDKNGQPRLDERGVRLGLLAILLHDAGYLKPRGDHMGTGAKFTPIHVQRSAEFAARLLSREGFPPADLQDVQSMICCTGVNADIRALTFGSRLARRIGCALASADLLGQMAATDYPEKLPALYAEFAEAAARSTGPESTGLKSFQSAEDLVRRTPAFWEFYVLPRLESDFEGVYHYLRDPVDGTNEYVLQVETNLSRIRAQFAVAV